MSAITEESWQKAFKAVRDLEQFEIDIYLPEPENSLHEFFGGQNTFCQFCRQATVNI